MADTQRDQLACHTLKELACEDAGGAPLETLPVIADMFSRIDTLNGCGGGKITRKPMAAAPPAAWTCQ